MVGDVILFYYIIDEVKEGCDVFKEKCDFDFD